MAEAPPVDDGAVRLPPAADWIQRPFDATRAAPVWVGLGLAAVVLAARLLWDNLTGTMRGLVVIEPPFYWVGGEFAPRPIWRVTGWWTELVNAAMLGVFPTVGAYLRRGARRDLADLRPSLDCSPAEFEAVVARATSPPAGLLHLAGVVGLAWGLVLPLLDPNIGGYHGLSSFADPRFLWVVARHLAMGWLLTRLVLAEVDMTRVYASVGESLARVDLLDLRPLAPFARKGLRSTLLWVLTTSVFALFWLAPAAGKANGLMVVLVAILVTAGFILPVGGVHRRIRAAKRAELDRIDRELRSERDALLTFSAPRDPGGARLANLVAWRGLVERVREWPYDASTLLRFALVVGLGLGSWLGGAIVDRLLDAFLG